MRIRSITAFLDPEWPINPIKLQQVGTFLQAARQELIHSGFEVQSVRIACLPFPLVLGPDRLDEAPLYAQSLEQAAAQQGIEYASIGPALPAYTAAYTQIPAILSGTQNIFATGCLTLPGGGVSLPAVRACAEIIRQSSLIEPNGFGNLRFAALANVKPGSPFFPAAYADGDGLSFAFATESADLAVEACTGASSLQDARDRLIAFVNAQSQKLTVLAAQFEARYSIRFAGIDFTLAPFPEEMRSFSAALERMGVPAVGLSGTLAAAAFLADSLDRAFFPRTGFCGLMFPVLEDAVLAQRAAEGQITANQLLLYSSVCGTGLDTVPLPGDTAVEQLFALLLDLAALAQRLDKPLTARLMPVPGKAAGEMTDFDFDYFANSRILPLDALPLQGLFIGDEVFYLKPRPRN